MAGNSVYTEMHYPQDEGISYGNREFRNMVTGVFLGPPHQKKKTFRTYEYLFERNKF